MIQVDSRNLTNIYINLILVQTNLKTSVISGHFSILGRVVIDFLDFAGEKV